MNNMKITQEMLDVMLDEHSIWVAGGAMHGCIEEKYAIRLINKDLSGLTFRGGDLRYAVLRNCDLWGCDLSSCNLRDADLSGSDLRGADLRCVSTKGGCALDGALLGPVSVPLKKFYQELQGWIVGGCKKHHAFKKDAAICEALERWSYRNAALMCENDIQFMVRGLDRIFPFNRGGGWSREQREGTFYGNPRRLDFIKEMAK